MGFLDHLLWRYATKKYRSQKVNDTDLETLIEAIRHAPSASGVQPYHVIVVGDSALKDRLFDSNGQIDKKACSHLFIFCTRTDFPKRIDDFIHIVGDVRNKTSDELIPYSESLKKSVGKFDTEEKILAWAARQAYLALGFGLAACAELGIDSSPMEGFNPEEFRRILNLPGNIRPIVLMAIGYRDLADENQPALRTKVRFPKEDLFEFR
jgi:nitroreductase/dihydropteridine reductase